MTDTPDEHPAAPRPPEPPADAADDARETTSADDAAPAGGTTPARDAPPADEPIPAPDEPRAAPGEPVAADRDPWGEPLQPPRAHDPVGGDPAGSIDLTDDLDLGGTVRAPDAVPDAVAGEEPPAEPEPAPFGGELIAAEQPQAIAREAYEPTATWVAPHRPRLDRTDHVLVLVIGALSLALHLFRLGAPGALLPSDAEQCVDHPPLANERCYELIPLDEVHYVPDARDTIRYGTASDDRVTEQNNPFVVHPPVGKWFIAAGIELFGDRPFGWRFFGAVFGALASAALYIIARRLWAARWAAVLAGVLLAVEGLWFVQSRVAMLDVYAASFLVLGIWMLIEDRDRTELDHVGRRWWRIAAGIAFGLALASKWGVGPLIAAGVGVAFVDEILRARASLPRHTIRRIMGVAGSLMLLPVVVYLATEIPWAADAQRYSPHDCDERGNVAAEWVCYQEQVITFHRNLEKYGEVEPAEDAPPGTEATVKPKHPYFGHAWTWPWIGRPVAHHFESLDGEASEVLGLPNPAIWWPAFFLALPLLGLWSFRRGDPVAPWLFALIIAGWAPYLFADAVDRPVFLFYATPMVPFLVLGVVHVLVRLTNGLAHPGRWALGYGALAVGMFAFFYPVLSALAIPRTGPFGWQAHMWFSGPISDCSVQDAVKILCWI